MEETKKCKYCKLEIDSKASRCPHCQGDLRGWFRRHPIWTGILGFLFLVWVIGAFGGGKKTKTSENPSTTTAANQPPTETKTEEVTKIGESVQDKELAFTVVNIDTAKTLGNQFTKSEAQGLFYIITLKIENKGSKTQMIDSLMLSLTDDQDRKYDRSIEGQTAKGLSEGKVDLFLAQVQPGLSLEGDIVFDIPANATGLQLIVKGSVFSSGKKINLSK